MVVSPTMPRSRLRTTPPATITSKSVVLAEDARDLQVVGDDPQAAMAQQRARHLLGGGADVDEQRGIVGDLARDQLGDAALLVEALHLARLVGGVLDARGQAGAAVVAPQQFAVAELVDVAADGLRRHVEMLGQRLDRHEAALAHEIEDLLHGAVRGAMAVRTSRMRPSFSRDRRYSRDDFHNATFGSGRQSFSALPIINPKTTDSTGRPGGSWPSRASSWRSTRARPARRAILFDRDGEPAATAPARSCRRSIRPTAGSSMTPRRSGRPPSRWCRGVLDKARAQAGGRRRHRHHQPARDDGDLGPQDRQADPQRHRLAGPAHGGALPRR